MAIASQSGQAESTTSPSFKASGRFPFRIKAGSGAWDGMTATLQIYDDENDTWDTLATFTADSIDNLYDAGSGHVAFRVTTGADSTDTGAIDWVAG